MEPQPTQQERALWSGSDDAAPRGILLHDCIERHTQSRRATQQTPRQESFKVSILERKLSPTERRLRVAFGVRLGKSNRAIAKDLGVDEGTVRRDRNFWRHPNTLGPSRKSVRRNPRRSNRPIAPMTPTALSAISDAYPRR